MKKKYLTPILYKHEIYIENGIATASIVTGGTGSTPTIIDEEIQESTKEEWEFNL